MAGKNNISKEDLEKWDQINHPDYYMFGRFEVIDVVEDWKLSYHLGNVVKYIARAGKKDPSKELVDLKKALWYLERYIGLKEKIIAEVKK